jgi:hypothetical protein
MFDVTSGRCYLEIFLNIRPIYTYAAWWMALSSRVGHYTLIIFFKFVLRELHLSILPLSMKSAASPLSFQM